MRILLINKSPVVGKLVTLSAQKTGDELQAVDSIAAVPAENFDLLLLDNEFYTPEHLQSLQDKIHFEKSILIADRGTQKPTSFTKLLEKPFLPTDLVETLLSLASSSIDLAQEEMSDDPFGDIDAPLHDDGLDDALELEMDHAQAAPAKEAPIEDDLGLDDSLDFGSDDLTLDDADDFSSMTSSAGLDDELSFDSSDDLGLDDLTADAPAHEDALDFDDASLHEDIGLDDELEGTQEAPTSVLDANDISEVKGLLEEEDNLDDLLNEVNVLSDEALEEEPVDQDSNAFDDFDTDALSLDDKTPEAVMPSDEITEPEFGEDLGLDDAFSLEEETPSDLSLDDDGLSFASMEEPEEDTLVVKNDGFGSLADEALSEVHDDFDASDDALSFDDALEELPADDAPQEDLRVSGQHAALTAEALSEAAIDEELVLDDEDGRALDEMEAMLDSELTADDFDDVELPAADNDALTLDTQDELDTLTEAGLSEALGEETLTDELMLDDADDVKSVAAPTPSPKASSGIDQAQMLQTLLASLESDKLREALKGMKISINISFDE